MNTNVKRLLSLLLALMLMIPAAMAEEKMFAEHMSANIPEISANDVEIPSLANAMNLNEMNLSNQITEETITYMVQSLHWFCALYQDTEDVVSEWCVPVLETDDSVLYMVQVSSMMDKLDGSPDLWAVSNLSMDDAKEANIFYVSEDTETILVASAIRPSVDYNGFVADAAGMTGYGFRFVEEDGESQLSMGTATLEKNGEHYTVPSGTFEVSSPVYTEDGKLIGVSDGGKNVYSFYGVFNEYMGEEPADEPADEPVAAPVEEPEDEPAEEPVDEPTEAPTKKPAKEPADEPEEDEDDEPAPASKGDDKGIDKNLIIGIVAVVVVAGAYFLNKKKKAESAKKDAQQKAPERPVYNQKPITPKAPAQDDAVTQPADDIPATVLVTPPTAKRIVVGIRCVSGAQAGAVYRLEREVRIGRDPKRCSIILPQDERGVSGLHCSVVPGTDGTVRLTDLGSSYGTFVNGQKLPANMPRTLGAGERFQLADGNNRFEVFTEEI